jgi:hypothetical protein
MFNVEEVTRILAALDGETVLVDGKPITLAPDVRMTAMALLGGR